MYTRAGRQGAARLYISGVTCALLLTGGCTGVSLRQAPVDARAEDYDKAHLFDSIRAGDTAAVSQALSLGVQPIARDTNGCPALIAAVLRQHEPIVKLLIDHGASVTDFDSEYRESVLNWAASLGSTNIMELLIAHGAQVEGVSLAGHTPMWSAAVNGSPAGIECMLRHGAQIETRDRFGMSALCVASRCGRVDAVRVLLSNGADLYARDSTGASIVDYLTPATDKNDDVLRLLHEHHKKMVGQGLGPKDAWPH